MHSTENLNHHARLETIICLESVSCEQVQRLYGNSYICPVCRKCTVKDSPEDWVLEPVTSSYICLGCCCDAAEYVMFPDEGGGPPRPFSRLVDAAGLTEQKARLIWLKHLQNAILVAMRSGRAEKTADDDLLLIAELIARSRTKVP